MTHTFSIFRSSVASRDVLKHFISILQFHHISGDVILDLIQILHVNILMLTDSTNGQNESDANVTR